MANKVLAFLVLGALTLASAQDYDRTVVAARVESCRGCSLNRLPEVKTFIYQDLPQYEDVEFKHIQGAPPELVLLAATGEEIQRLPLSKLTRLELNELMETRGFVKKPSNDKTEF